MNEFVLDVLPVRAMMRLATFCWLIDLYYTCAFLSLKILLKLNIFQIKFLFFIVFGRVYAVATVALPKTILGNLAERSVPNIENIHCKEIQTNNSAIFLTSW